MLVPKGGTWMETSDKISIEHHPTGPWILNAWCTKKREYLAEHQEKALPQSLKGTGLTKPPSHPCSCGWIPPPKIICSSPHR